MKNLSRAIRKLMSYMGEDRKYFLLSVFLVLLQTAANALSPFVIGLIITEATQNAKDISASMPGAAYNFAYFGKMVVVFLGLGLVTEGSSYFSGYFLADVVQNTMFRLRKDVVNKINRLPMKFFDEHQQGDLLSRITNDVDTIGSALQQSAMQSLWAILSIIFTLIMMLFISIPLGLIGTLIIPLAIIVTVLLVKRSQKHFQALQNQLGEMSALVQESYTGFSVIKLYGKEKDNIQEFGRINDELAASGFQAGAISGAINPLIGCVDALLYIVLTFIGTGYFFAGKIAVGSLQAVIQYIWQINQPITQVAQLTSALQGAAASAVRIFEILDEKEEEHETKSIELPQGMQGTVSFKHVQFGYDLQKPIINDLNLEVEKGQMVAIVGPTGAGKTTIINLLLRFYEIQEGEILIDGISTRKMTRDQLRSLIGIVSQDPWLYHASIADNIRFGKLDASFNEVIDAAKTANVDRYINALPSGYDMEINAEAENISQGQKQLMTIARAVISNPLILILDEATSSVDTRLELLIQNTMKKVMNGRTSFVIAHRLSTIREADLILVLKEGDIIEQGTHDSLIEQGGFYEELYNSQFGLQE